MPTILVYDAKTKEVYSVNAEGTAPKLATIEWYKEHNGGKLPISDSLLAGTVPGLRRCLVHPARSLGHDELRRGAEGGHRPGRKRISGR